MRSHLQTFGGSYNYCLAPIQNFGEGKVGTCIYSWLKCHYRYDTKSERGICKNHIHINWPYLYLSAIARLLTKLGLSNRTTKLVV